MSAATTTGAVAPPNAVTVAAEPPSVQSPVPAVPAPRPRAVPSTAVRPEIQALRAIAVLLVLVYHLWPRVLHGGFVGVDVFFGISGFLITSLLLREIDRTGTISLSRFWARRARRILPASLVTLLFCALATIAFVPLTYWGQFFADMRASTEYVQNWHLAATAVDYFAADQGPSPVQHFWSLSAEEQFYIVWPVLLVLALLAVRQVRGRSGKRVAVGIVMGALTAASFVWSVRQTASNPAAAYFVTPTRAWEFGAGGLLALAPAAAGRHALRSLLSWTGIAAILIAAVAFSDATPFPGIAATLPILGTLAVIQAGTPARAWSPTPILRIRPLQFVGDVSYSIYLWHWPLLILAPFVIGSCAYTSTKAGIFMLTIFVAWLSKLLVEDPVRSGSFLLHRKMRWTYGFAAAATAIVLAVTVGGGSYVEGQVAAAQQASARVVAAKPKCFGAAARDRQRPCSNPKLAHTVVPSPVEARKLGNAPCTVVEQRHRVRVCEFGIRGAKAQGTVALLGDSHASHWRAALAVVARREHWRGVSITHTSCPLSKAVADIVEPDRTECAQWTREVPQWLSRHPEVHTVFVAAHSGGKVVPRKGEGQFAEQVDGYIDEWQALPASVQHIIVIRDTPKMRGTTLDCIQRAMTGHRRAGTVCAVPRSAALDRDPEAVAAARLRSPRVQTVDMTPFLCDRRLCYPVIGGALVYKDIHHLTAVYGTTLGPYLQRDVERLMASWPTARGAARRQ